MKNALAQVVSFCVWAWNALGSSLRRVGFRKGFFFTFFLPLFWGGGFGGLG